METKPTKRYASDLELQAIYGIDYRTWRQWRFRGQGPTYAKLGKLVRYDLQDVEAWFAQRKLTDLVAA